MPDVPIRPTRTRRSLILGGLAIVALAGSLVPARNHHAQLVRSADAGDTSSTAPAARATFATDEAAIPDETVLAEQLDEAIDLFRREQFDRALDARDPGELIEHATLTSIDFEHRSLDGESLFVVGDELFELSLRPEDGWGRGGRDRDAIDYTPQLVRVHRGVAGGPDAFACSSCHSKGGPDGAGAQTQNAFLVGDGERTSMADERNPPHLLGLGPVELLAREMTAELQAQADEARERARLEGKRVEQDLIAKGVSFGRIAAEPDGSLDASAVRGVDPDLVVRPFGWKGHQATIRDMSEESFFIHQGLVSRRVQLGVRDGTVDPGPYGKGTWYDVDEDGVSLEIDAGMLVTMFGYLAQLEVPIVRPPRDPGLLDAFAAGRAHFEELGCAGCHVPTLQLDDPKLVAWESSDPDRPDIVIDVAVDGDYPKIEPKYARDDTPYLVNLFSDLRRHEMGAGLATPTAQGSIPAGVFLTRSLWGLAETAPYLHDGRAPTLHEAILLHGGDAAAARDSYAALDEAAQAGLRVYLASLSRQPRLHVP